MRIGAVLPQNELDGDVAAMKAVAAAADELGFAHVLAYDHVLGAMPVDRGRDWDGPYDDDDPFHDPFVLFSHLAALHPRLEFATGIIILPQRQTALVARQAADVAMLAPGGLRLGVGVGWNWTEYDALGQDFSTRGRREDEQIPLLRALWSGEEVTATVDDERIDRMVLVPAPPTPPTIWLGGFSEPAFRRGARLGDGFLFGGSSDHALAGWERTRELLEAEGRDVASFGADWLLRAPNETGTPDVDAAVAKVERWRAEGGTHTSVVTLGLGFGADADAHIAHLADVAAALDLAG